MWANGCGGDINGRAVLRRRLEDWRDGIHGGWVKW